MRKLVLKEIYVYQGDQLIMHCDNESAMNIDCRKSYVSRAYQTYSWSDKQIADIFTKEIV